MTSDVSSPEAHKFEVVFQSLSREGRGMVFPCDASGRVDLDSLPERKLSNYLFARAMVGREFATPRVCAS